MSISDENINYLTSSLKKPAKDRLLSPIEIAKLVKQLTNSVSISELSLKVGLKDKNFLKRFLRLLTLPSEIQNRIKWTVEPGTIAFTQAYEIAVSKKRHEIVSELMKEENKLISRIHIRDLLR